MKKSILKLVKFTFSILFISLALNSQAQTIKVAAAANLRYALDEIKANYIKKNPSVKIDIILGSSGTLTQQIINGANFHLFMAADKTFPEKLKEQGVASGDVKTYAFGKLVLWSNTVDVSKGINTLTENSVKRIAIAKPELAPYGARAVDCLKYYKLYDKTKSKLVFADNISQAAQFAQSGNAEVAFLAMSLVFSPDMKGTWYELDSKSYKPVEQGCVLIKGWERNPEAAKFLKYILSIECKPIFEKYGYIVP